MSRAINLDLPEAVVVGHCEKLGVSISAIETLPNGGTHLVCTIIEGADLVRNKLKRNVIEGRVKRFAFMTSTSR